MLLLVCGACGVGPGSEVRPPEESDSVVLIDSPSLDSGGESAPPEAACRVSLSLSPAVVPADGRPVVTLHALATDRAGNALPDGTLLTLVSTGGRLEPLPPLVGGESETTLHSATRPGQAEVGALDCEVAVPARVTFSALGAWSAQLHVHGSLSEGSGTMRGFGDAAHLDGLDLLWWTDHDVLYHKNPDMSLSTLDWESGELGGKIAGTAALGPSEWVVLDRGGDLADAQLRVDPHSAASGAYGLRVEVKEGSVSETSTHTWRVHARNQTSVRGTLGGVQLRFKLRRLWAEGAELRVRVPLSSGEGERGRRRSIVFFDGGAADATATDELWVPMGARTGLWVSVAADISALADAYWPDAERDLSARLLEIELQGSDGGFGSWDLDDFQFSQRVVGDALRDDQRAFLDEVAAERGVSTRSWVGAELSGFGEPHFNAFGSHGLLLDYDRPGDWGPADAVAEVQADGGLVSYNHMFGVGLSELAADVREELVHDQLSILGANAVYGVDLLEVGYRRRGGLTEDFLRVWDGLGIDGLYLTGIGTSDVHDEGVWALGVNNFVTWVAAGELEEEALLWNLRRGAAWFGDPRQFPDGEVVVDVEVPAAGANQGQVVIGHQGPTAVVFTASALASGWVVRAMVDGEEHERATVTATGAFSWSTTVEPAAGRLVRFEVLSGEGEGLLYSNPIYFVDSAAGVPAERLPVL